MSHTEAYRELEADRENVQRWFRHRSAEYRRQALKATKFPLVWWTEYTSPRKNRYLIGTICLKRGYDNNNGATCLALRREQRGYTVYMTRISDDSDISKTVFLQHFYDRYRERAHIDLRGIDLIRHFADHMNDGIFIRDSRMAGRSVRYNGRDHTFVATDEGVMLGDMEDDIFIVRTFITYDMATGIQKQRLDKANGKLYSLEDVIREINIERKRPKY